MALSSAMCIHMGFIANTLSQGVTGTIRGNVAKMTGAIITLRITVAENESLRYKIALSTIVTFKENEPGIKIGGGGDLAACVAIPM